MYNTEAKGHGKSGVLIQFLVGFQEKLLKKIVRSLEYENLKQKEKPNKLKIIIHLEILNFRFSSLKERPTIKLRNWI